MDVNGVTAIVTGGASGLGAAVARRLVSDGANLAIFDMQERPETMEALGAKGKFYPVDVTNSEAVSSALDNVKAQQGVPRVLVNCAGIAPPAKVLDRDGNAQALDAFARIVNVNLIGTFNMISKFAAELHRAEPIGEERGIIVNTASVAAFEGQIGQAAYAASKGGVVAMGLPIARELARYGIRVNTIAPGIFLTPMLQSLPQEAQDSLGAQVPFPSRLGDPAEFAKLVAHMIDNAMLNGEVVRLDGAIRMAPK